MFTKNFQALLAGMFNASDNSTTYQEAYNSTLGTVLGGQARYRMALFGSEPRATNLISDEDGTVTKSNAGLFMLAGTGSTPPTKEDIKLAALAALTPQSLTAISNITAEKISTSCVVTETFGNFTEAPITITELGVYVSLGSIDTSGSTYKSGYILLARELLAEPVVIEPGALHTFQMTLDFSNI